MSKECFLVFVCGQWWNRTNGFGTFVADGGRLVVHIYTSIYARARSRSGVERRRTGCLLILLLLRLRRRRQRRRSASVDDGRMYVSLCVCVLVAKCKENNILPLRDCGCALAACTEWDGRRVLARNKKHSHSHTSSTNSHAKPDILGR